MIVASQATQNVVKGGDNVTNLALLEEKIKQSGKKKAYLAKKVGLTPAGFRNCCLNKSEFRTGQVQILCEELNITSLKEKQAIFFAQ